MRKVFLVACLGLALSGCDALISNEEAAIRVCEGYIIGKLKAPATYKRVEVTVGMLDKAQSNRDVFISYDAANSFGTPLRSLEHCSFDTLANGDFPSPSVMSLGVSNAQLEDTKDLVGGLIGGASSQIDAEPNCCRLDAEQRKMFLNK